MVSKDLKLAGIGLAFAGFAIILAGISIFQARHECPGQ
jgi:hypothetical protein